VHFLTRWKPQWSLNNVIRIGLGVAVVLAFVLHEADFPQSRFIQQLELLAYDARLRLFMPKTLDPRVVILDIDEKSLNVEGRWPWSRNKLAHMVKQLFERYQVRVLGFDVAFPEADPSSGLSTLEGMAKSELSANTEFKAALERIRPSLDYDRLFAEEIAKHPVVLGFFLGGKQEKSGVLPPPTFDTTAINNDHLMHHYATGYSGNIPMLQKAATAAGHLYPFLDFDGLTRRVPMFVRYESGYYEALALAMIRTYLGNEPAKVKLESLDSAGKQLRVTSISVGDLSIPLDDSISALIPYRGSTGVFRYVSATDVVRGTLPVEELKDKIVIVGTSAQGLLDLRATPVREDYPGVEVHANLLSGFLDQSIMQQPAEYRLYGVLTALLLGLPLAFFLPRLSAVISTGAVIALATLLLAINIVAWKERYVFPLASPLLMLLSLYLINMAYGFFTEARSRRLITGLFGTYVPRELVEQMSKNPEEYSMRGESREMTVLFSDVRDFTSISEGLTAEGLKDMMNAYLTAMTEVIQEHRGTIDKYIGDAIMAFWGAPVTNPDHARHGLEAGLEMQRRIRRLDPEFIKRGWPVLHIGVGLNSGEMNVGDMGSKFRRAYTVMGDAVNLASRLEGLTKEYGVGFLVSENVVNTVPSYLYREIDKVQVKGRLEGVSIYEPLGRLDQVDEATVDLVDRFHRMLEHYRAQRWDDADKVLVELAQSAPDSKLYKLFRQRIFEFRYNPPGPAWNGVWIFKTK
jgi:adenylate cyclase